MPIAGTFTLKGTYEQLGGAPAAGNIQVDGIPNVIVDATGDKVKVGPKKPTLDTAGTFTITLPTDVSTGTSTTLGYRVTARLKHNNLDPIEFYAPAAGTTLDIADVTPQSLVALTPTGVSKAEFDAYVASNPGGGTSTFALSSVDATKTASATLTANHHTPVDATTGAKTMTLPTGAAVGALISVEKIDTSINAVTVTGTLRGVAAQSIPLTSQYEVRTFLSEGAGSWRPVFDHRTRASLNATYAPVGDRAFQAVRTALAGGRSAAVWGSGDSTLDSSGGAGNHALEYLATNVATTYPGYRVIAYTRDGTTDKWNAPTIVQAGTSGRRYASFSARAVRYRPPVLADSLLTTGNLDVRALINPTSWTPAAFQSVVARVTKDVGGTLSNDLVFWFGLDGPSGKLQCKLSADGTTLNLAGTPTSTVAVTPPTGGDGFMWIRVTVTIDGTGRTMRYYTSPADDGFTWTQLGADVTSPTTTAMHVPVAGSFFEVGATGWQPAATAFAGKIAEVQIRDGVDGPTLAPNLPELWERYPDPSTTYGGSPEFRVLNAARAGTAMTYHTDTASRRLWRETPNYGQSVLVFCDSHNEVGASGQVGWTDPYKAWVQAVQARTPNAAVVVVKQTPHTSAWANETTQGPSHVLRLDELARLADSQGWSVADWYSTFLNDSRGLGVLIGSDGLHPTTTGYVLTGDVLIRMAGLTTA